MLLVFGCSCGGFQVNRRPWVRKRTSRSLGGPHGVQWRWHGDKRGASVKHRCFKVAEAGTFQINGVVLMDGWLRRIDGYQGLKCLSIQGNRQFPHSTTQQVTQKCLFQKTNEVGNDNTILSHHVAIVWRGVTGIVSRGFGCFARLNGSACFTIVTHLWREK